MLKRMIVASAFLVITSVVLSSVAWATHTVSVPDYPTLAELESGWNAAFVSWLTRQYGGSPTITSTVTYSGQEGQIFVVSRFTAGSVNGTISGRAFDPVEGTALGGGEYWYEVASSAGFSCIPEGGCQICNTRERRNADGSTEWKCNCIARTEGEVAMCGLIPADGFAGSYKLVPGDYGSLPVLD